MISLSCVCWNHTWKFLNFSQSSVLKVTCSGYFTVYSTSHFFHTDQYRLFVFLTLTLKKVSVKQQLSLDMPSSLMCKMIFLFCWLLYRDRFKCLGGTPIHPHVQHSPMASFPFPVPRKKHVIVNPDLALIHIHSPSGSQTHAWTINSCTAINLAQREERIESPRFRQKQKLVETWR